MHNRCVDRARTFERVEIIYTRVSRASRQTGCRIKSVFGAQTGNAHADYQIEYVILTNCTSDENGKLSVRIGIYI